jgi:hypothetical protein
MSASFFAKSGADSALGEVIAIFSEFFGQLLAIYYAIGQDRQNSQILAEKVNNLVYLLMKT